MPVDPKGLTPGLAPKAASTVDVVSLRCKNPTFPCDSMEATEIKLEVPAHVGQRAYRCVKCGFTLSLAVGGAISI